MNFRVLFSLLCLLFTPNLFAEPREVREDTRQNQNPCREAQLQACILENHSAADTEQAQLLPLDPRLAAISHDLELVSSGQDSLQAARAMLEMKILSLEDEKKFLEAPTQPAATSLLPGFLSLADFFVLHPLERNWRERASAERLANLSARLREAGGEKANLGVQQAQIAGEISRLSSEKQSVQDLRVGLLTHLNQHVAMWSRGCKEGWCPSGN